MNFRRLFLSIVMGLGFLWFASSASAEVVFMDVASDHPNYEAISALANLGVIQGYPDHTFRPDQTVNRAEALKILLLGSGILVPEIQTQEIFPDVLSDAWYGKYVAKAKNLGIVSGDATTGLFRPGDTVNLAEALKMLLKTNSVESPTPKSNPYADVPLEAWFAPYFEYARVSRLLDQTTDQAVMPATGVSRAVLAELMYRFTKNRELVPDGKASYYGAQFHGKTTANGEVFDASAMTAAHRTLPFNSWVKVTNVANGKSVLVCINDRGPYVTDAERIIDLSKAAFEQISPLSAGVIRVRIELAEAPAEPAEPTTTETSTTTSALAADLLNATKLSCPEVSSLAFIDPATYSGITLTETIPDRLLLSESLRISGTVSTTIPKVTAFIVDSLKVQTSFPAETLSGKFTLNVRFPKEGTYKLGILPGESGQSVVKDIVVLKNTCIEEVESQNLLPISGVSFNLEKGDLIVRWSAGTYNLFKVSVVQGGLKKSYFLHSDASWKPYYKDFASFKSGNAELLIRGAKLTSRSMLEPAQILWSPPYQNSFIATSHYEYTVNATEAEVTSLTPSAIIGETIKVTFKPKVPVRSKAAVILPNGKVQEIAVASATLTPQKNAFGQEIFPATTTTLTASYKTKETAVHFLEVNNAEGLAMINVPVYARNQYPLIPNPRELARETPTDLGTDWTALRTQMLTLINKDRAVYKLSALSLDDSLTKLAQYRSDDMVTDNYFSHWDKDGRNANDLRMNYGIQTLVGENLAKDTTLELAEYGLMRSAIHRTNILSTEWTRVGIGITKESDGGYVFVQIFSTNPLNMEDLGSLRNSVLTTINKNRGTPLVLQDNLNTLAQNWSQKMADEDFFDFQDKSGQGLVDLIRGANINTTIGTYIMANSSFADALSQVSGNTQLQESHWINVGIGIKQDNLGIIKITLIYTE